MGNTADGPRLKIGKTLTDANIAELSGLTGFTPDQVREWHSGFLVSKFDQREEKKELNLCSN